MKLHISTASQRPQALLRKAVVEKASLLPTRVALKAAIVVAVAALVEPVALLGEATVAMVEAKEVFFLLVRKAVQLMQKVLITRRMPVETAKLPA